MNRIYEIYNPDSFAGMASNKPDRVIFCKPHAKKVKKLLKRGATTLYFRKCEETEEPCF